MRKNILINTTISQHQRLSDIYKPKIEQLLRSTVPTKGKEFPKIIGPKYNDKVCIVGAGPAGLHMAVSLKDKGYQTIRIFEKTGRHGGKSYDTIINGTYQPQGTTYLNADSVETILKLAERYNASEMKAISQAGVWVRNTASMNPNNNVLNKLTQTEFVLRKIANITRNQNVTFNSEQFLKAIIKYTELHYELFGKYRGMLMQEPTQDVYEKISGTIEDFLIRNDLKVLVPAAEQTYSALGYGFINEIGALYGLMWITPRFLLAIGLQVLNEARYPYETYIFKNGFENLWNKIVEKEHFDIRYNTDISLVLRKGDNHVTLLYSNKYQYRLSEDCDFLIWTPPMPELMKVLSNPTLQERELFNRMTHHVYVATIIKDTGTIRNKPHVVYYESLENLKNNITNGEVSNELDVYGELNYCDPKKDGSLPEGCKESNIVYDRERTPRITTCYELRRNKTDEATHRQTVRKHYVDGFHATNLEFIHTKEWEYFYKWSPAELENGNHWKVLNIQGKHGIWYAGASVSFESAKDVLEYNNLLIRQSKQEGSGQHLNYGYSWSPNVESVFRYTSADLSNVLRKPGMPYSNILGHSLNMVGEVKIQAFNDKTLRLKLDHIHFYSKGTEVSLTTAHQILETERSIGSVVAHNAQTFKNYLTAPFMVLTKGGVVKRIIVSMSEPAEVTEIKKLLAADLKLNNNEAQLQLLMKKAITTPLATPRYPMKIDLGN